MKKLILILFVAISSLCVPAQVISHQFSINGGGGWSSLKYKLPEPVGRLDYGFGGDFGMGYTLLFAKTIGIHIGAGVGIYNAQAILRNGVTIITPGLIDNEGDRFDLHSKLNNYRESQNAMFVNIPVMLQLQVLIFYAMGGVKVGIPVSTKYSVSDATITNAGYYPEYDNWLTEQEFAGFGTFTHQNFKGKLDLGISTALSAEAGLKFGKKVSFGIGVYFDYGFNNILKDNGKPFMNYTNSVPAEFCANSVLPSLTKKAKLMAAGLKVRLAF